MSSLNYTRDQMKHFIKETIKDLVQVVHEDLLLDELLDHLNYTNLEDLQLQQQNLIRYFGLGRRAVAISNNLNRHIVENGFEYDELTFRNILKEIILSNLFTVDLDIKHVQIVLNTYKAYLKTNQQLKEMENNVFGLTDR